MIASTARAPSETLDEGSSPPVEQPVAQALPTRAQRQPISGRLTMLMPTGRILCVDGQREQTVDASRTAAVNMLPDLVRRGSDISNACLCRVAADAPLRSPLLLLAD